MNFLAHCYLSGASEDILIGNFIADSVKGKDFENYNPGIIEGIRLHRLIDEYTDTHEIVKESKRRLSPAYGKYGAVVMDIFYDHFLAVAWKDYSAVELKDFVQHVYRVVDKYRDILPERVLEYLPYMVSQNWLYNYSTLEGIAKTLKGMAHRAKFESHMESSIEDLKKDYELYKHDFGHYFPQLIGFVASRSEHFSKHM